MTAVVSRPLGERPRERLLRYGAQTLSDRELVAVILGSGTAQASVYTVAQRVLKVVERDAANIGTRELMAIAGVGPAKAAQLASCLEFARRFVAPRSYRIRTPSDVMRDETIKTFPVAILSPGRDVRGVVYLFGQRRLNYKLAWQDEADHQFTESGTLSL